MDIWQTDEVYGDYLIEKETEKTKISYTRFGKKYGEATLYTKDNNEIKDWICKDSIKQIQLQFTHLWEKLKKELDVCMEEKFRKRPKITLSPTYLQEQIDKTKSSIDAWPESALLNLGRVLEIWLLIILKVKTNYGLDFLIKEAELRNLIGAIEISSKNEKETGDLFNNFAKIIKRVYPKRHFVDVFRNELDIRIFILLKIYKELSLKEMNYHTGKSKAQLSRRTRDLIRLGLIQSYIKEDEVQSGNIKRKYYKLSKDFDLLMEKKEFDLEKAIKENNWEPLLANIPKFSYEYKKLKMISDHINSYLEATESHLLTSVAMEELPMIDTINVLMEALENNLIHYHFISEKQYERVKAISLEFNSKLEEILKNDDSLVKPYLYMDILLNMLGIIKIGNKTSQAILGLRQAAKKTQKSI